MHPEISNLIFQMSTSEEAIIHDYKSFKIIRKNIILFYPALVPFSNSITHGKLFRNISNEQLKKIDCYEGDEYKRELVNVSIGTRIEQAWCYIWQYPSDTKLEGEWTLDYFLKYKYSDFKKELGLL